MVLKDVFENPGEFIRSTLTRDEYTLIKLITSDLGYKSIEDYFDEALYSNDLIIEDFRNRYKTPLYNRVNKLLFEKARVLGFPRLIYFKPFQFNYHYLPLNARRGRLREYFWPIHNKIMGSFFQIKFSDPTISMEELELDLKLAKGFQKYLGAEDYYQSKLVSQLETRFNKREYEVVNSNKIAPERESNSNIDFSFIEFDSLIEVQTVIVPLVHLGEKGHLIFSIVKTICERGFSGELEGICSLFDPKFTPPKGRIKWNYSTASLVLFFDLLIQHKVINSKEYLDIPDLLGRVFLYTKDEGTLDQVKKRTARNTRERFDKEIGTDSDILKSNKNHQLIYDIIVYHCTKI